MAKVKVEYEPLQIRHLAIQCPNCEGWFKNGDISEHWIYTDYDLFTTQFHCPRCGCDFTVDYKDSIESTDFPEFYDNCLKATTTWE